MPQATYANPVLAVFGRLGEQMFGVLEFFGSLAWLGWDVCSWTTRSLVRRSVRFGTPAFVSQMVRVGVRSVPIVALVSGCIGFILALQTAPSLDQFNQTDKVANLVAVAVFRELGPLIAAIVLTGWSWARRSKRLKRWRSTQSDSSSCRACWRRH
jgi:phospholipid/cholesterol/gamma-HCH transport system permease protein